jgi:hypothetical protein
MVLLLMMYFIYYYLAKWIWQLPSLAEVAVSTGNPFLPLDGKNFYDAASGSSLPTGKISKTPQVV